MNSQPISVISEYKKLNLDFEALLNEPNTLDKLLKAAEKEKVEIEDTLKATQFCYNQTPNQVNKQILESTNLEALKIKYRLIMLKILDLLSKNKQNYQEVKEKREKLLELIEARTICLKKLGVHILVEPFARTKVKEQLDSLLTMTDNSKTVSDIKKEIAELTARTEEMTSQNNNYLISLSNTKNLIEDSISFGDIDVTNVELHIDLPTQKEVTASQIIKIRNVGSQLNMSIVAQKTKAVIRRVNQMINGKQQNKVETKETYVPDLVIVPKKTEVLEQIVEETFTPVIEEQPMYENIDVEEMVPTLESFSDIFPFENEVTSNSGNSTNFSDTAEANDDELSSQMIELEPALELTPRAAENNEDLFETITPFAAPTMFNDRVDEIIQNATQEIIEFPSTEIEKQEEMSITPTSDITPSETFWPTQENFTPTEEYEDDYEQSLSFDEQIDMLMSSENNSKVLKKVA